MGVCNIPAGCCMTCEKCKGKGVYLAGYHCEVIYTCEDCIGTGVRYVPNAKEVHRRRANSIVVG